ncbi:MAG: transglutaminase-like domain-containing protein [Planctomycetes bacterium]|nr:transglutaminase-like domain-containing protein [Planctomycetota bacterium]
MASLVRPLVVTLGVISASVFAGGKVIDPNNPPQGRFTDEWAEVFMGGEKVGFSHSTIGREGNLIQTSVTLSLEIKRMNQAIAVRSVQSTTETVDGVPTSFETTTEMSTVKISVKGTVKDGKVTVVQSQFGVEQSSTLDYPTGALMAWGMFRESQLRGYQPGTEYSAKIYEPSLRLDDAVTARTAIGEWETFEHRGKEIRGQRVVAALESPMGTLEMVSWVDRFGMPLKAVLPMPGFGELAVISTDQASALADFAPPELFMTTVIKIDQPIDRQAAQRVEFRMTAKTEDTKLDDLPDTDMQSVVKKTAQSVEILVTRQQHKPAAGSKPTEHSPEMAEYLEANLLINTDDPELAALAKRAAAGETEPFALADKLRKFVTDFVLAKNLNIGFASASEVCRTREGDCSEHAVLLAALGRLNGLPSRVAVGIAYLPSFGGQQNVFGYHMWTQFYIQGRWVDVDAALRETQCSPARIAFATSSLKNTGLADLSLPLLTKLGGIEIEVLSTDTNQSGK